MPILEHAASRSASSWVRLFVLLFTVASASRAPAQESIADSSVVAADSAAADSSAEAVSPARSAAEVEDAVVALGLENVAVREIPGALAVRFENRRFRHSAEALGEIARIAGRPVLAFEQRLGWVSAAISDSDRTALGFRVRHPSDNRFPAPPAGPLRSPTKRTVDLLVRPLFSYTLGGLLDEVQTRIQIQTELRYNPWPGGQLRAAWIFPAHDDFSFPSPEHPDVKKSRPGPILLDQFAWSPGALLFSTTVGTLGNNRYGLSLGFARPLKQGQFLLDAQTDLTGYMALEDSGWVYSTPNRMTGFAGVSWRPPNLDFSLRVRLARFLRGDQGIEVEMKRSLGDLDVALFAQRTEGENLGGLRLGIPFPPTVRPTGWPVRVLPVDRIQFLYSEDDLLGESISNTASREDFLRQLDRSALMANEYRYQARLEGRRHRARRSDPQWVSLTGMTGFVTTPWAGVMADRAFEIGYNHLRKEASWDFRDQYPNEVYYAALGFLPHTELGLRWTVIPGYHPFREILPESPYVDADRMISGRIELLPPRTNRPGVAVGIEDGRGTRRFHSTYAVAGMPFDIYRLQNRVTMGYAPRVFTASRRTLDGLFGAVEVSARRSVAAALEYDSERWNTMLGINLGFGLRARVALLDLEHLSFGAGWFRAL